MTVSYMLFQGSVERGFAVSGNAEYKNKWQSENCDRIHLVVKKGQKELIRAHAKACGESINAFVVRAIHETMERDSGKGTKDREE